MAGLQNANGNFARSPLDQDLGADSASVDSNAAMTDTDEGVSISTEKLDGRRRRIVATTQLPFALEQVWQVLTDYDSLADFIPNLTQSQRVAHPEGGIRLEQMGAQCFLNVKFCARVVLDMLETFPKEIQFTMVEGDFRQFEGRWLLEPLPAGNNQGTQLSYDLLVLPPRAMPAGLIERHIRRDLSQNLTAVCDRTKFLFG